MKAYTVDTLWTTMIKKISYLPLEQQYKLQHVDMGIQYVTKVVASDVSTSHHQSFRVLSWAQQTMDRVRTVPQLDTVFSIVGYTPNLLYLHLGQKSHLMCFDSMLVIFNGFSIYQLLSENRKRQKSPDIFINSLPRSRNFRVSQSLAVGRGFRITWGVYLITTKQCPESFCIWRYCENENVSCHSPDMLSCPCVCDVYILKYHTVCRRSLHDLFDVINVCRCSFMRAIFAHWPMSAGYLYGNGYWINL